MGRAVGGVKERSRPVVTRLERKMPSPSRKTRDGEASTKPSLYVAVDLVEAAPSWGGQSCVLLNTNLSLYWPTSWIFPDEPLYSEKATCRVGMSFREADYFLPWLD